MDTILLAIATTFIPTGTGITVWALDRNSNSNTLFGFCLVWLGFIALIWAIVRARRADRESKKLYNDLIEAIANLREDIKNEKPNHSSKHRK
jgi:uncharacterized membrane protein YccC